MGKHMQDGKSDASDDSSSEEKSIGGSEHSSQSESNSDQSEHKHSEDESSFCSASPQKNRKSALSDSDSDGDRGRPTETRKDIGKKAVENPDLYGIRRSERTRKEVPRLNVNGRNSEERRSQRRRLSDSEESESEFSETGRLATRNTRSTRNLGKQRIQNKKSRMSSSEGEEEESDSYDSDEETPKKSKKGGKGSKNSKQRATRRQQSGLKISYKEESDDVTDSDDLIEIDQNEEEEEKDANETIEKVIKSRYARKGATGSKTTVYNIEKEGDPNEGFKQEEEEGETQYLIKWKNWAYVHNTWESETGLRDQKVNGIKKLENFMRKEEELERWRSYATAEDQEYYNCQQEMSEDLYEKYCLVERIVCHIPKAGNSSTDYLVKWQGLPYSECTNEDGALILKRFPEAVEQYNERLKSTHLPNKNCKALKVRPKFQSLKAQPDYIGGKDKLELRDYQLAGLNWLLHSWCKHNGAILADEMGLGKTIQTISYLTVLVRSHGVCGPFLLVVPLSTLVTWQKEFEIWSPGMNVVVYIGDVPSRNLIREHEWYHGSTKQMKFNVIITTYEIVLKDKAFLGSFHWAVLGVDEAHRLKNDDSRLYKVLMEFDTSHRVFITGTPLQNSLKELWSLLHFIMPEKFDVWEDFEKRHSSADKTGFRHLHQELEPYLLRRVKKDVEKSLPAKVEQILRVEMTKVQKYYYKLILKRNYKELMKGTKGSMSTFVNMVMELKKCSNHSFLVRPPDDETNSVKNRFELLVKSSGKLILLDKLLLKLRGSGHRVLIFSQMVRMLDILAEYLQLRHFPYQRLDGTIKGDIRKQAMDHFNAEGSQDFCFLLSTRAGGLGVNLATADTVVIFDSDWNPQNDLQAMARAHRIGQKNQVSVYRLVTKNSVEEDIVERAKKKMVLDHLVIQRMDTTGRTVLNRAGLGGQTSSNTPFNKEELNAILKFGAEELFKEGNDDDEDLQVDIDDILRLAETRNTEELKNNATDELLSKFKVVSFDNLEDQELEHNTFKGLPLKDWEDIIPEDERKKIDEEERMRLLKEQNLPPRSRKTITGQARNIDEEDEGRRKRRKRLEDDESSSSDYDSNDGDRAKRKGRSGKEVVKGFNESELRRFLKSLKKFGKPLERLEDISEDADLQEKSESDLKNLGEMILTNCEKVMSSFEAKLRETTSAEARKAMGRPTFKLGSITVNARSVLQAVNELEPLAELMPADQHAREKFQITVHVKNAHFDCSWSVEDDARLLRGVYECGFGNWEAIKMDTSYRLQDKILADGDLKPQAKQLQARTEYLMKVLRKLCDTSGLKKKSKPVSNKSSKKIKSKEIIDENANSDEGSNGVPKEKKEKKKNTSKEQKSKKSHHHGNTSTDGPVHITTHKTVSIEQESGLDPQVFLQCKEKMRVVKKSLQYLKNPSDKTASDEKEVFKGVKECLIKIGDHINNIIEEYKDTKKAKEWRGYLWHFVSMFTDNFEPSRLHKMYRQALKKKTAEQDKLRSDENDKGSGTSHYSSTTKQPSTSEGGAKKEERRKRDQDRSRWGSQSRDRPREPSSYQRNQGPYGDYRQQQPQFRDERWRSRPYGEHDQPPPASGNFLPPPGQFSSYQSGYPPYDRNKGNYQRSSGSFPSSSREYATDSPRYYGPRRPYVPGDRRDQWGPGNSFSGYENPASDSRDPNKSFNRKRRYDDSSMERESRARDSRSSKESRMSPGVTSRYPSVNPLPPPPNPGHTMLAPPISHYDIPLLPPPPSTQYSSYPAPKMD